MISNEYNKNKQDTPIHSSLPAVIPENQVEEPNKHDDLSQKSEEVQAIIDRMPTYWTKWVVLCVGILMGIIILLGFLIQYPDTVDGQISVTATTAPVRLVANGNGRITLLQSNKTQLQKGDVIAYMESGADYKHILLVDTVLNRLNRNLSAKISLPNTLILGEVSSSYNAFLLAFFQYKRLVSSDIYTTMRQNLRQQIQSDEAVVANLNNEVQLKNQILHVSADQLQKDSVLLAAKGISEQEYKQQQNTHLSLQEARLNLQ